MATSTSCRNLNRSRTLNFAGSPLTPQPRPTQPHVRQKHHLSFAGQKDHVRSTLPTLADVPQLILQGTQEEMHRLRCWQEPQPPRHARGLARHAGFATYWQPPRPTWAGTYAISRPAMLQWPIFNETHHNKMDMLPPFSAVLGEQMHSTGTR